MAKLSEVLKQATVTLKPGDYLASITDAAGFIPSIKGTTSFAKGRYLFKVVGVGAPEGDGSYKKMNIVPMVAADDFKSFKEDLKNPIVLIEPTKVTYTMGRNDKEYHDVYRGNTIKVEKDIAAGKEHRMAVLAFIEFVKTEYSLGVNDFALGGSELVPGA
ncbi:hypothetical protein QCM8_149 [Bacillus phage QCM8]|nr:hypothetical protein QCM8_149 [Bacillus phage QCM8]